MVVFLVLHLGLCVGWDAVHKFCFQYSISIFQFSFLCSRIII